jgi:hypothetical protein
LLAVNSVGDALSMCLVMVISPPEQHAHDGAAADADHARALRIELIVWLRFDINNGFGSAGRSRNASGRPAGP